MPERFAAVAPCSGVFFDEEKPWLIEAQPTPDNETGFTIAMWLRLNGMEEQIPEDWSLCLPETQGRWNDRVWTRDGAPEVRFTTVEYMPHATMTEMSCRIWKEFFSKF